LIISKEIENTNTFLTNLDEQSNILLNDASVLSPQYSLKLEEINSKMNKFLREMNNMTIVSPVNGTITDLMVEIGESVNSGETDPPVPV
jgi:biotin carboxyl carrier protein